MRRGRRGVLIIDNLFLAPFKGLVWVFKKIDQATREELESQKQRITSDLSELYMQLETGKISEQQFDEREKVLLDHLDTVKRQQGEQEGVGRPEAKSGGGEREAPSGEATKSENSQNAAGSGGQQTRAGEEAKTGERPAGEEAKTGERSAGEEAKTGEEKK